MPTCPKCGSTNTYFENKIVLFIMAVYKCNCCGNEFLVNALFGQLAPEIKKPK